MDLSIWERTVACTVRSSLGSNNSCLREIKVFKCFQHTHQEHSGTNHATSANKAPRHSRHLDEFLFHAFSQFFEINDVVLLDVFVHKENENSVSRNWCTKTVPYMRNGSRGNMSSGARIPCIQGADRFPAM